MTRPLRRLFAAFVFLTAFAVGVPQLVPGPQPVLSVGIDAAQAQEKRKRKSLLSILFGRRDAKKKAVKKRVRPRAQKRRVRKAKKPVKKAVRSAAKPRKRKRATQRARVVRKAPAVVVAPVVEKEDDARTVLVIGDFFAAKLAEGLEKAYADAPEIVIVDRSNGLSGLVRADVVNWPARLPELVEELKPDHIVAMLGANDRQLIREGGKRYKTRTQGWDANYTARVAAFGDALKATKVPYIWMGLPSVRFRSMNKDLLYFNELYAKAAEGGRGTFVDVWDGFADADGNYTRSGPDVNGQIVLLRPKDGINLTAAGRERLTFYIQASLRKSLTEVGTGGFADPGLSLVGAGEPSPSEPTYDPARSGKTVVIALDNPAVDGATTLAGESLAGSGAVLGTGTAVATPNSVPEVLAGRTAPANRADNASWPPPTIVPAPPGAVARNGT